MAVGVYGLRFAGLALRDVAIPEEWERGLRFVPAAVLTALVVSILAGREEGQVEGIVAVGGAAVAARLSGRMWVCIVSGMGLYWLLRLVWAGWGGGETVSNGEIVVRHGWRPGDLGRLTALHGEIYAEEYGFDQRFEAYVAETLGEFGRLRRPERDRLWLAEVEGRLVGSIGIVGREEGTAQLRWLLIARKGRGRGLGRRLLGEALEFCREAGYHSVYLWTVSQLTTAARMYLEAGFRKTEELPPADWGAPVVEERYELSL
jgi:branched-subunit amino acid transport protein/GNAT superfamily N-acetyltransferase